MVTARTNSAAVSVSSRSRHSTTMQARLITGWLARTVFHQRRFVA